MNDFDLDYYRSSGRCIASLDGLPNAAMFARHTPTRMRGSGVVQGLKSLVSKLHPQLPLSPKESQRLLTALTGSFRKQLDQAYPRQAQDEDVRPKVDQGRGVKPTQHALHTSSVAFADKHLASVLTNPLLAKTDRTASNALNLDSAKLELEKDPEKDPISLLEKYHEQGAATVPLADFCLRTFQASLLDLTKEERQQRVAKFDAGLRTLRWLWRSELYKSSLFLDDRRLMGALVVMLIEEEQESFLWSWLRMDLQHDVTHQTPSPRHRFRWKDFMIRLMVMSRRDPDEPSSMNHVLDVFFKAIDLHLEVEREARDNYVPVTSACDVIMTRMLQDKRHARVWDEQRYNRFMDTMGIAERDPDWIEYKKAFLRLIHPKRPSPLPIYKCIKESFYADPNSFKASIWYTFAKSRDHQDKKSKIRNKQYFLLIEIAHQLKHRGQSEEAEWLVSQARATFPEQKPFIDKDMREGLKPPKRGMGPAHPLDPTIRLTSAAANRFGLA